MHFQRNYLTLFENTQMPSGLVRWLKTTALREDHFAQSQDEWVSDKDSLKNKK